MKVNDAIFGLLLLALGSAVLFAIQGYPKIPGQPVGPALFPGMIATGLCLCGFLLVIRGLRQPREPWLVLEDWVRSPRHLLSLAVLIASIIFYIVAADTLGFLPTSLIILVSMFRVLRVSWGRTLLLAVIATLAIHFAFYKLLRVPLPWGVLTPFAW